jgi:hypothetical protein
MSIVSSFLLILIVYNNRRKLKYKCDKAKNIYKKGSFFSLIFLLAVSSVYYFIRIFSMPDMTSLSISILVFFWPPVTVSLVCCLNYLPRVHWEKTNLPCCTRAWWKTSLNKNSNFIIYWLALVLYFVEITCKLAAIMLDVAHDVAPLIQQNYPQESGKYWGGMVILIGFRMALHARLLSFFWEKFFHGEKDLFSEPSAKLDDDQPQLPEHPDNQPKNDQMQAGENVGLEEINRV